MTAEQKLKTLDEIRDEAIANRLREMNGRVRPTAESLGLTFKSIYNWLRRREAAGQPFDLAAVRNQ